MAAATTVPELRGLRFDGQFCPPAPQIHIKPVQALDSPFSACQQAFETSVKEPVTPMFGSPEALMHPESCVPSTSSDCSHDSQANTRAPWIDNLLEAQFFLQCPHHPHAKRNECNLFCLSCTEAGQTAMCQYCLPAHAPSCCGKVFQVRKYMYQDVVHVDDLQPLLDVSRVQPYCINGRKALLLQPRASAGAAAAGDCPCGGCPRSVRPGFNFCSVRCRVDSSDSAHSGAPLSVRMPKLKIKAAKPRVRTPVRSEMRRQMSDDSTMTKRKRSGSGSFAFAQGGFDFDDTPHTRTPTCAFEQRAPLRIRRRKQAVPVPSRY